LKRKLTNNKDYETFPVIRLRSVGGIRFLNNMLGGGTNGTGRWAAI
jgi:hypothetical protein